MWVARRNGVPCEHLLKEIEDFYNKEMTTNPQVTCGVASESPVDEEGEEENEEEGEEGSEEATCAFQHDIGAHLNSGAAGVEEAEDGQSAISNWTITPVKTNVIVEKLPAVINVPTNINVDVELENESALSDRIW